MNLTKRHLTVNPAEQRPWLWMNFTFSTIRPLSGFAFLFGLLVITGYLLDIEGLYRPISGGPATNPLTALCILLLATGIWIQYISMQANWLVKLCTVTTLFLVFVRLGDAIFDTNATPFITPFYGYVVQCLEAGKSNSMGVNTAVMMLTIALASLLRIMKRPETSQIVSFIAVGIPTISFTGYLFGLNQFYGQMSLISATLGWMLAVASLAATAHVGALRAVMSPYIGGRVARLQIIASSLFPIVLGFIIMNSITSHNEQLFGLFVVCISWFSILLNATSAMFLEESDHQRRANERLLFHAATQDALTGLANRRSFFDFANHEIEHARRNQMPLWLLMLDVDYFKHVNDTAGHDVGDKVLVKLAEVLQGSVRTVDQVSRIGGEEFAIVLLDTTQEGAKRVSQSLLNATRNMEVEGWTNEHGPVTLSIGAAALDAHGSLEEMMKSADTALYKAKDSGRDRACFAGE